MADPALQMGGGGGGGGTPRPGEGGGGGGGKSHPDPGVGGGGVRSPKNFCRPFGPQFALKNKGEPGPPGPFPGSATATAPERSSM